MHLRLKALCIDIVSADQMSNMLRVILSAAFLAVYAAADPLAAQHSQAWNACAGKDGAPRELVISGCALVVQSGKATNQQLEAAYSKLCAFSAANPYSPRLPGL